MQNKRNLIFYRCHTHHETKAKLKCYSKSLPLFDTYRFLFSEFLLKELIENKFSFFKKIFFIINYSFNYLKVKFKVKF